MIELRENLYLYSSLLLDWRIFWLTCVQGTICFDGSANIGLCMKRICLALFSQKNAPDQRRHYTTCLFALHYMVILSESPRSEKALHTCLFTLQYNMELYLIAWKEDLWRWRDFSIRLYVLYLEAENHNWL